MRILRYCTTSSSSHDVYHASDVEREEWPRANATKIARWFNIFLFCTKCSRRVTETATGRVRVPHLLSDQCRYELINILIDHLDFLRARFFSSLIRILSHVTRPLTVRCRRSPQHLLALTMYLAFDFQHRLYVVPIWPLFDSFPSVDRQTVSCSA